MGGVRRQALGLLLGILAASMWKTSAGAPLPALGRGSPPAAVALGQRDWFGRPAAATRAQPWQQQKNPTVAMVSSFLIPGLGQLYNEREFWSLVAAGVHFYFIGDIVVQQRLTNQYRALKNLPYDEEDPVELQAHQNAEYLFLVYRDNRIQSTWLLGLTLLLSGLQSYVDAHLFDFDAASPLHFEPSFGPVQGGALRLRF